ncbi:MAG: YdcF family protein [Proteobacteria bacterium]|jgi:uncharacterized SAM-binding protein YcdF (DUF218 family)|nr:YdcF family protein [Pseudomonadota bacterium]
MRIWFESMIAPLGLLCCALALLVLLAWWTRIGRRPLAIATTLVALLAWFATTPLASSLLLGPLQAQARRDAARCGPPPPGSVFIVLAGGVDGVPESGQDIAMLQLASMRRVIGATDAALATPDATLLMSGGSGGRWREADLMAALAQHLGFPRARILRDRDARTTFQSAVDVQHMLAGNPAPRYLVTSAEHMPRAYTSFVHTGQRVCALPVDFHGLPRSRLTALTPQAYALNHTTNALHEYLGLLYYHLVKFQ